MQIPRCNWLPECTRCSYLVCSGLPARNISLKAKYRKSFIGQACSVKIAGHWPRPFMGSLWASTPSWSISRRKQIDQYPAILPSRLVRFPKSETLWNRQGVKLFIKDLSCVNISSAAANFSLIPHKRQWIKTLTASWHSKTFLPIPDCYENGAMRCFPLLFFVDIVQ